MFADFKKFLMRGNVVDLAVAVVIGAAFKAVVDSLVADIVNPLLGLAGNKDFSQFVITLRRASGDDPGVVLRWGALLTTLISFVAISAVVFFAVVKPLNALAERRRRGETPADEVPAPTEEVLLLTEIRDLLASRA